MVHFTVFCYILEKKPTRIFYGHLEKFVVIWYIFPVVFYQKSGNPDFSYKTTLTDVNTLSKCAGGGVV
jgi:hypothetical protein